MPIGAFRLNSIAKGIAAGGGGGGGPAIPTTTWTVQGHITSTVGTQTQMIQSVLGYNNSRYFSAAVSASTSASSPRSRIGSNLGGVGSTTVTPGFSPTSYASAANFNASTSGGNWMGMMASSTSVRFSPHYITGWNTNTALATSNPSNGAMSSTYTRTSGSGSGLYIVTSKYPSQGAGYLRTMGFWQSGSNLVASAFTQPNNSSTLTQLFGNSTLVTGGVSGDYMGAAGFTNDATTLRWVVGALNTSSQYGLWLGTSTHAASHGVTSVGSIFNANDGGGVARMWDDATAGIYIAGIMGLNGTTISFKPIKITDWTTRTYTLASTTTTVTTNAYFPKIIPVERTDGLCLVVYMTASPSNRLWGRWLSVDPTTLDVQVGSEFSIGFAPDNLNISSYGLSCVHDSTYKFIGGYWAASGGDGGPFNITGA